MKSNKVLLLSVFVLIFVCINPTTAAVPIAQFRGTPITGSAPLTVTFTDQSTGSPTGWAWYFGDENFTEQWTLVNASAGWTPRFSHSCAVMPDGSIVLMGGRESDIGNYMNDVWRSTDNGSTWILVNTSAGWTPRYSHTSVVMEDSSIVLMGGYSSTGNKNDVWRSTDNGSTWILVNASAGWTAGYYHSSVVMPDGSIVLMGGYSEGGGGYKNDVWRSTDKGTSWTQVNASAGWIERAGHSSVAMPDGSIVLMGGYKSGIGSLNDVWRSTDKGTSWTQVNASAAWSTRHNHISVLIPDGSIILIGGQEFGGKILNDVWRFVLAGSSAQNPFHTYNNIGIFPVTLQVYNIDGYNSTKKTGYITVTNLTTKVGVYKDGVWYLDWNGNGTWENGIDSAYNFGVTWWSPVVGDWNSTGKTYIGITNGQQWYLDWNGNGAWDNGIDKAYSFGAPGWINVTGDWNHDGKTEIGVTNGQQWYLDANGNGAWDSGVDYAYSFGAPGWTPIVGDWNATGFTYIGVTNGHQWYLDNDGSGTWNTGDKAYIFGAPGWKPIVGDWNATGKSYIGVTNGQQWYLDWNGNGAWDGGDRAYNFGAPGWIPITGDWNGDARTKIGITNGQQWYLDTNGNGLWDIMGIDYAYSFGAPGWTPIVGKWS